MTSRGGPRIGVDIGGTKCLAVAINEHFEVIYECRRPTPRGVGSVEALVKVVADAVAEIEQSVGSTVSTGVGVPGLVADGGVLRAAPNLDEVADVEIGRHLSHAVGRQVAVDNDATCGALAEWQIGAAQGASDVAFISLGTGIGGGLISNGGMQRGKHGYAAEFGHMMIDPMGPQCPCGQSGCWERYASGSGLAYLAQQRARQGCLGRIVEQVSGDVEVIRSEHVLSIVGQGDDEIEDLMCEFARWIAVGLVNLAHVVDPEVMVLGGGVGASLGDYVETVRSAFSELIYQPQQRELPSIVLAELGEQAGAIGAALLPELAGDFTLTGVRR